jgi:hypothetical protein
MRIAIAGLALACLIGATGQATAQPQTTPSTTASPEDGLPEHIKCFKEAAVLFDDRISPADVVANAVGFYCWGGRDLERALRLADLGNTAHEMLQKVGKDIGQNPIIMWGQIALPFVLQARVSRLK